MRTVELFCGTKSFSKVAGSLGYDTFTTDIEGRFEPTLRTDILKVDIEYLPWNVDILWSSPPCTAFSVASIGKNWDKETREPKTEGAKLGVEILKKTIEIIKEVTPKYWFIENPRGMMRKVIEKYLPEGSIRHTVTYCQYGDTRMKPTDIWTNATWWKPKAPCKNGDKCHVSAPRGSRTGTQGIKNAELRSVIPEGLFIELFKQLQSPRSDKG